MFVPNAKKGANAMSSRDQESPSEGVTRSGFSRRDFVMAGGAAVLGAAVVSTAGRAIAQDGEEASSGLPPEFTAPAENLEPGAHDRKTRAVRQVDAL